MANLTPNYTAYRVVKRENQDDFWLPIGAAWLHEDGSGANILLQALPLPDRDGQCKIVLRVPKTQADEPAETHSEGSNKRRTGNRREK